MAHTPAAALWPGVVRAHEENTARILELRQNRVLVSSEAEDLDRPLDADSSVSV